METQWLVNIVTVTVISIIGWLIVRFIASFERRLKGAEMEADEIRTNYIKRFEEVHEKIEESERRITEHFTREIKEVVRDKSEYRIQMGRDIAKMETKVDQLIDVVRDMDRHRKP